VLLVHKPHVSSGGAKVAPAGARAPAVKTCAPAVGWSLNGEGGDNSSQLTQKMLFDNWYKLFFHF